MRTDLTYAQLIRKHGGTIVRNPDRVLVTAMLSLVPRQQQQTASAPQPGSVKAAVLTGDGLLNFKFILRTSGVNDNDQFFVEDEMMMPDVYKSPIGEPVDIDHLQGFHDICGEITASQFVAAEGDGLSAIKCNGVIFAQSYPKVAEKVQRGAGRWAAVSMEALPNPLERVGKYLVVHMPKFVGAGLVRFPGCRYAKIEEVGGEPVRSDGNMVEILKAGVAYLLG